MRLKRALTAVVTVGLLGTAAACGEPTTDSSTSAAPSPATTGASSAPAPAPAGQQNVTNVTVTVAKGKVSTASGRVKVRRGATVRFTVTSDAADEFHLHGYDRTLDLRPGRPAVLELTADKPGVFEAELHHSKARVLELQVG